MIHRHCAAPRLADGGVFVVAPARAGTGPRGGKDMDKVVGTTYWDILRATLTRADPEGFLFFNHDADAEAAGMAFIRRLGERRSDRDEKMSTQGFLGSAQRDSEVWTLRALRPFAVNPTDPDRQRRP